ncbi:MAG: carbohydrate kinase [Armatimonadetes bacterium]|nr:carbohydrate kinase [Armatimonadota bacterium]
MTEHRLQEILDRVAQARVLVVGDYFLDKYLVLEAALTEVSIETGLEAYQVVEKRLFPGAAGTVTSNLRALDAGSVHALGMIGIDGEGFELKEGLNSAGVRTELLVESPGRFTPTYTKPMLRESGEEREMNRLDIKNRRPCPQEAERQIIQSLRSVCSQMTAVIVSDQVQERNFGVITDAVRKELSLISRELPDTVFIADSRNRIGEFTNLSLKPNKFEAYRAIHGDDSESVEAGEAARLAVELQRQNGRPCFVTLSEQGILAVEEGTVIYLPTLRQTGPIDIVGAGDSVMAGIALSLCSGATPLEAAMIGNLVASITVQQIGVTGTASRAQVLQRFRESGDQFQPTPLSFTFSD